MAVREQMWYGLNDGRSTARPRVVVETWTFDPDFMPESVFRYDSRSGRKIERQLLRNVRKTVHGDLNNARRAVDIARREIDRHYHP